MSDAVGVQVWAHLQLTVTHVTYGSLEKYFFSFLKLAAFLSGKNKKIFLLDEQVQEFCSCNYAMTFQILGK